MESDQMRAADEHVAELTKNPHGALAEVRAAGSVQPGEIMSLLGTTVPASTGLDLVRGGSFSVFGFDAARTVLLDGSVFSSAETAAVLLFGRTILGMDDPEHRSYRALISSAFSRKQMQRWREEFIVPELRALLEGLRAAGSADLVTAVTFPFPIRVIARMLGLPDSDLAKFHQWAIAALDLERNLDEADRATATEQLVEYLHGIVDDRRASSRDDLIGILVASEHEGQLLTDEEIVSFVRLLLPAGSETTYRASGSMLLALLSHPDQFASVASNRALIPPTIEETLRWEPPIMAIGRVPVADVTLDGCPIPAGSAVHLSIGAANRDPVVFANPDRFDISRPPASHLAFAAGSHTCLGLHLARMEMAEILAGVIDVLPNLRLDPDAADAYVTGLAFRSPNRLPVVWDT